MFRKKHKNKQIFWGIAALLISCALFSTVVSAADPASITCVRERTSSNSSFRLCPNSYPSTVRCAVDRPPDADGIVEVIDEACNPGYY